MYAHPGNTDAYGGHIDWTTGEYHYHHGYPAHYHTDSVCPYEDANVATYSSNNIVSSSDFNKEQFYKDWERLFGTPTPKPTPILTPKPTATPIPVATTSAADLIGNFVGKLILSLLFYAITYSALFLAVMVTEDLVIESNTSKKASSLIYNFSISNHMVCFIAGAGMAFNLNDETISTLAAVVFAFYVVIVSAEHKKALKSLNK